MSTISIGMNTLKNDFFLAKQQTEDAMYRINCLIL